MQSPVQLAKTSGVGVTGKQLQPAETLAPKRPCRGGMPRSRADTHALTRVTRPTHFCLSDPHCRHVRSGCKDAAMPYGHSSGSDYSLQDETCFPPAPFAASNLESSGAFLAAVAHFRSLFEEEAPDADSDYSVELLVKGGSADVRERLDEVLGADRALLRTMADQRFGEPDSSTADRLDDLALAADQVLMDFESTFDHHGRYAQRAATDVMQSVVTTTRAIALLLRHGYVIDAEARWRGLHELTCCAALMATTDDLTDIATRYLAHGRRLPPDDPAYDEDWADATFFAGNHMWLKAREPGMSSFRQWWIFQEPELVSAPFDSWIKPSHQPVHMSAAAVSRGAVRQGHPPAGYNPHVANRIGWQVACSLYEGVTHLCVMMSRAHSIADNDLVGWPVEIRRHIRQRWPAEDLEDA